MATASRSCARASCSRSAPPQELYERPVNLFVGGFIGSPAMNLVEATIERHERRARGPLGQHAARR